MECPTLRDFVDFLEDYSSRLSRYEYVNPLYNKRKKPHPYKSVYLKINDRYNLFYIYEDTSIYSLKELAVYLNDYLEGLYPELNAPFEFVRTERGKELKPLSLKRISGLKIIWKGKATNPEKGEY